MHAHGMVLGCTRLLAGPFTKYATHIMRQHSTLCRLNALLYANDGALSPNCSIVSFTFVDRNKCFDEYKQLNIFFRVIVACLL